MPRRSERRVIVDTNCWISFLIGKRLSRLVDLLALAIEARAHYLVTGDQDLLVLREVKNCRIVDATTFEQIIK